MTPFVAEFLGTFVLLFLGNGVVANVSLKKTYAQGGGDPWVLITTAWGFAVFCGVVVAGQFSGAHLNPAVTLGLATVGKFDWQLVPIYLLAQLSGAFTGGGLVYLYYYDHFKITDDENTVKSCFCTGPAIRNYRQNLFSEFFGTFLLVFVIFYIASPSIEIEGQEIAQYGIGSVSALPVALLVWVLGLSIGGTTGYAINPARDLGPRIFYALLRRPKKNADWAYAWVPILGPLLGGLLAGVIYNFLSGM